MSELVRISQVNGVCTLQLNRAEKKNALNAAMYEAMSDALQRAESDPDICVVVFCGVPGCFTAGNDLGDFLTSSDMHTPRPAHRFIRALTDATIPLVAAVDGDAVGIGTTLLLHCDFVFATARATFRLPFVDLSLCPEAGSSMLLPRLAGHVRAAELLMLGDAFDGDSAYELGLITAVCDPDSLIDHTNIIARRLAKKPRAALRATKSLMRRSEEPVKARVEAEIAEFANLLELPASKEIMTAFVEKRAPDESKFE